MSQDEASGYKSGEDGAGEVWRDLAAVPGMQVSDQGRVRSGRATNGLPLPAGGWRVCKLSTQSNGYLSVGIGNRRVALVHRLVLEAFAGPCPPGWQGCHRNGEKRDNRLSNLRWDTARENCRDLARHGRVCGQKFTKADAADIKQRLAAGQTRAEVERVYDLPPGDRALAALERGRTWGWLEDGAESP